MQGGECSSKQLRRQAEEELHWEEVELRLVEVEVRRVV